MKYKFLVPVLIVSAALFAACDDNGSDTGTNGLGTGTTPGATDPAGTGTTPGTAATPDATTPGMGETPGATGATPGMNGEAEQRVRVMISDTEVTVQPESSTGENVILEVMNNTAIDRDILIIRLGDNGDGFSLFGAFGDDDAVDRAGLDVVEEATVDANSDHEISSDMDAGNYVVLSTNAAGSELLWAEFSVRDSSAASN